ncbi:RNA-binding protein regulatory protein (pumilio family) [Strigomonas culicis]|nr:RNA-binding protein regulatory protein (pumilio family) [Strigomonas culicis]|eukprot:EPY19095.1 RNA-binding protein regulatory protein (pumilio family) [Strigomonas culicis]
MNEIIPHVAELMTDQYANFLVQKLFDIMPDDVRYNVARVAAPKISMIALTPHGTFSVQKMIETISTREEMEIVRSALSKDVVRLVKDTHGNHVIQKVLQRFDYSDKEFIYEAVASDCVAIAKNKQGCCVLQRCLEHASPDQKTALVKHILSCCLQVVQDPFGNYVLQYVLEAKDSKINDTIAIAFLPHLVQLCMNKFSSNVMEKVLRGASVPIQEMYVETMCNHDIVSQLIQDDFGNYVLQTALSIAAPSQAEALVSAIRPLMPLIKSAPYAKKLEGKIDAITKKTNYRPTAEYENVNRPNGSPTKYDCVNGTYSHHRMHPDNRSAPWQAS